MKEKEIEDTTGSGDAFIGGFIAAFLLSYSVEDSLKMGTVVAAEKLRGIGARSALPTMLRLLEVATGTECRKLF